MLLLYVQCIVPILHVPCTQDPYITPSDHSSPLSASQSVRGIVKRRNTSLKHSGIISSHPIYSLFPTCSNSSTNLIKPNPLKYKLAGFNPSHFIMAKRTRLLYTRLAVRPQTQLCLCHTNNAYLTDRHINSLDNAASSSSSAISAMCQ